MTSQSQSLRSPASGNDECSICLNLFSVNPEGDNQPVAGPSTSTKRARVEPQVVTTKCGHLFHKSCAENWLKEKKSCPLCKKNTTKRGLTRLFNFPIAEEDYLKKYEEKVMELDVMKCKLKDEKSRLVDMVRHLMHEKEGVRSELNGKLHKKCEEVEELMGKMKEMKGVQMELQKKLNEKGAEVKELEETVKGMKIELDFDLDLELKLGEMARNYKAATDKLVLDFEREVDIQEEKNQEKIRKLKEEMEEKLRIEKEKNKFAQKIFVDRMKKKVNQEYERLKVLKQNEGAENEKRCSNADLSNVMRRELNGGGTATTLTRKTNVPLLVPNCSRLTTSKVNCVKVTCDLSEDMLMSDEDDNQEKEMQRHEASSSGFTMNDIGVEYYLRSSEEDESDDDD